MGLLHVAVERLDVERELTEVGGLELLGLQLERYEALQATVEEHEVDREVLVADLDRILRADEAEVAHESGEEAAQMTEQGAVEVGLRVPLGKRQELEVVGILQLVKRAGVNLSQRWLDFLHSLRVTQDGAGADLTFQLARGSALLDALEDVELAGGRRFGLSPDDEVVVHGNCLSSAEIFRFERYAS